jgi:adenine/guanine phosphoribosyltransferase-like PRPP-binding protein
MSQHIPTIHSEYLHHTLDPRHLKENVKKAAEILRRYEFEAIAFTGMSGAVPAGALALELDKSLIMVRKPNDGSHSPYVVEGDDSAQRYVIVDDFVSSGSTVNRVVEEIDNFYKENHKTITCLGLIEMHKLGYENRTDQERFCGVPILSVASDEEVEGTAPPKEKKGLMQRCLAPLGLTA